MKKLTFLLLLAMAGFCLQGQELESYRCSNGTYGFKDKITGKEVIPCKYDDANSFSEGLATVQLNIKWGFIDKTGKEVIPFKYDYAYSFSEGLAEVNLNEKYGFIDKTGKEVIPCKYNDVNPFSEGLARVQLYGKSGFIDKTGKEVIPFKYEGIGSFYEGLAFVKLNGKYGFIDKTGKEVIPFKYDNAYSFSEGLAFVKLNGKWGVIDKAGKEVIPFKYEDASYCFSEGSARVKLSGKWGMIDKTGSVVVPIKYESSNEAFKAFRPPFSFFAKNRIEPKINEWQQKGEFESTPEWQQRVNETTRNEKIRQLLKETENEYIAYSSKKSQHNMELGMYDADNEVFLIKSDLYGNLLIPVPKSEGQDFKTNWNSMTKTPKYFIENDKLALAEMTFSAGGKTYKYSNQASLTYTTAKIDYNFAPIDINVTDNPTSPKGNQNISTVNLNVGDQSDIAKNIPVTGIKNNKTFAVIIANENYRRESQVEFAKNDGETFKKYCTQTLGLPEANVHIVTDATLNDIRGEIDWLNNVADAFKDEANIIFYYAGHGIPDESSKTSYLLPIDGYGSNVSTGYKLDDLYSKLGGLSAKSVIVFMDACFSGAQRSGEMLTSARGVAIKAVQGAPVGNMIVFSAAQGDETAYPHREKGHGMFTYFLLKKLQESKGEATLGELSEYIETNVRQQSIIINRKSQTPTAIPSSTMDNRWREMKLK